MIQIFFLSSLRLSLQYTSSLSMFPLRELAVSDGFSEIKVEIGAFFLIVKENLNYV